MTYENILKLGKFFFLSFRDKKGVKKSFNFGEAILNARKASNV